MFLRLLCRRRDQYGYRLVNLRIQGRGNDGAGKVRRRKHLSDSDRHSAQQEGVDDPATPEECEPRHRLPAEQPENPLGFGYASTELQHPAPQGFAGSGRVPIADHDIWLTAAIRTSSRPASLISSATLSRGQ